MEAQGENGEKPVEAVGLITEDVYEEPTKQSEHEEQDLVTEPPASPNVDMVDTTTDETSKKDAQTTEETPQKPAVEEPQRTKSGRKVIKSVQYEVPVEPIRKKLASRSRKKTPAKPSKPLKPFKQYERDNLNKVKKEFQNIKDLQEIKEIIGQRWKTISAEEKRGYLLRYRREMDRLKPAKEKTPSRSKGNSKSKTPSKVAAKSSRAAATPAGPRATIPGFYDKSKYAIRACKSVNMQIPASVVRKVASTALQQEERRSNAEVYSLINKATEAFIGWVAERGALICKTRKRKIVDEDDIALLLKSGESLRWLRATLKATPEGNPIDVHTPFKKPRGAGRTGSKKTPPPKAAPKKAGTETSKETDEKKVTENIADADPADDLAEEAQGEDDKEEEDVPEGEDEEAEPAVENVSVDKEEEEEEEEDEEEGDQEEDVNDDDHEEDQEEHDISMGADDVEEDSVMMDDGEEQEQPQEV